MELHIKKATYLDVQSVYEYMRHIFELELNGLSIRPNGFTLEETKKYLPESSNSTEKLCAIAIVEGQIVGQITFAKYVKPEYRHGGKLGMSVKPPYWKKGIGTSLLKYLEVWASKVGIVKLELEVWANNQNAVKLYEKNGYLHEGCRMGSIVVENQNIDLILMEKKIC